MSRYRSTTIWNMAILTYVQIFAVASGILVVPLYLKYLPVEIYGTWLTIGNVVGWISLIDPCISPLILQLTSEAAARNDFRKIHSLMVTSLIMSGLVVVIMTTLAYFVSKVVLDLMNLPPSIDMQLMRDIAVFSVFSNSMVIFSHSLVAINNGLQRPVCTGVV